MGREHHPPFPVRSFRPEDGRAVARLHRLALPQGFLSTLGDRTLSTLYRAIGAHGDSTVLVADDGSGVVGFVAGTTDVGRCYRHVLTTSSIPLAASGLVHLFRPRVVRRVAETLTYPFRFRGEDRSDGPTVPFRAELLSIDREFAFGKLQSESHCSQLLSY